MKQYDFSTIHDRLMTHSIKADYFSDDAIPLWVADMDFAIPDEIIEEAKKRLNHKLFGYTSFPESLKEALLDFLYARHGFAYQIDDVIPYYSVASAMHLLLHVFTKPQESVVIMTPVYMRFEKAILDTNRKLVTVDWVKEGSTYHIDFESLELAMSQAKMLLLCNPHNPIGRVLTYKELAKIADISIRTKCKVISDEIHGDIIMPGYQHIPFLSIDPRLQKNSITLVSPTKTFNLASQGMAFILCPNKTLQKRIHQKMERYHLGQMTIMSMVFVEAAYRYGSDWLDQVNQTIYDNYRYCQAFLHQFIPQITMSELEGTYLAWLDITKIDIEPTIFFEQMAKVRGIDGQLFGQAGKNHYRLNLASPRSIMEQAMKQLYQAYQTLQIMRGEKNEKTLEL